MKRAGRYVGKYAYTYGRGGRNSRSLTPRELAEWHEAIERIAADARRVQKPRLVLVEKL